MEGFIQSLSALHATPTIPKNDFSKVKDIKTDYGNWVIPGRLMCGPTPGPTNYYPMVEPSEHQANMDNIIADGIDTFVCLQEELDPEQSYRHLIKPTYNIQIVHLPIKDESVPSKTVLLSHLTRILDLIRHGKNIYLHCAGGHGRTSLYISCILACLYKEMRHFESVLFYVQSVHDFRRKHKLQFYGILPCMVCCCTAQREMLKDFLSLLSWVL